MKIVQSGSGMVTLAISKLKIISLQDKLIKKQTLVNHYPANELCPLLGTVLLTIKNTKGLICQNYPIFF